jgi:dihydrofolate reductase
VATLDDALSLCPAGQDLWVIGGAEIYTLALTRADRLEITEVHLHVEGDALAPRIDPQVWPEVARSRHTAANGTDYSFVTRRRAG